MPQESALYGVARIRCHEKNLLGREKLARLVDSSAADALRQLLDAGYGNMPDATLFDVGTLIKSELLEAYALVREVTSDAALTDLFLMKADIQNIKLLLKLRLTHSSDKPDYALGGLFEPSALERMVRSSEYDDLPECICAALYALESSFEKKVDPVLISTALDSAYINFAYKNKSVFALEYFRALADFDNTLALLRLKAMGGSDINRFKELLLPAGNISHEKFLEAYTQAPEAAGRFLSDALSVSSLRESFTRGFDAIARTGNISAFERERDNYLIGLAREGRYQTDTVAPIVGYLLAREQEARCVRLILTAKRNSLPDTVITERLRELYG